MRPVYSPTRRAQFTVSPVTAVLSRVAVFAVAAVFADAQLGAYTRRAPEAIVTVVLGRGCERFSRVAANPVV